MQRFSFVFVFVPLGIAEKFSEGTTYHSDDVKLCALSTGTEEFHIVHYSTDTKEKSPNDHLKDV